MISKVICLFLIICVVSAVRLFKVNGQPIFIRGGNWILSDGLLRLSKKRYKTDIKFHKDMNFNMIRCWGGGLAERPEFYHYCDAYGLLVRSLSLWLRIYNLLFNIFLEKLFHGKRWLVLFRFVFCLCSSFLFSVYS